MCKKLIPIFLAALLIFAAGCGGGQSPAAPGASVPAEAQPRQSAERPGETDAQQTAQRPAETEAPAPTDTEPQHPVELLAEDGSRVAAPDARSLCTATETGVLYSVFEADNAPTGPAVYRWIDTAAREDLPLLTLEDQGYEAVYTRTELNGLVYTLALTGNPYDAEPDTLWLLCFDGPGRSAAKYPITDDGFPYASMAAAADKLLIVSHEMAEPKCDKVYVVEELDPFIETRRGTPAAIPCGRSAPTGTASPCSACI